MAELDTNDDGIERLIYVVPPTDGGITDADSDKSDDEHEGNLNHIGRKLLQSSCEVQQACSSEGQYAFDHEKAGPSTGRPNVNSHSSSIDVHKRQRKQLNYENCFQSSEEDTETPVTQKRKTAYKKSTQTFNTTKEKKKTKKQLAGEKKKAQIDQWTELEPTFSLNSFCDPTPCSDEAMECQTPLDFFSLFLCDDLLDLICEQSNLYASQKNVLLNLTRDELLVFFGGLLMSGYAKYPNKRMFWSREEDVPRLLSESIRCNRFEQILRFLHLNDNSKIDPSDRLYKLRPFIEALNTSFSVHGGIDEHLSIDESMIPYYGKHYAKQYIKGKPIRFGFKNWAICSSSGYLINFSIYTGKDSSRESTFGLGGDVVVKLIEQAGIPSNCGHKLFIDNFFTSVPLMRYLGENGFCATGTVRSDRIEQCPLKPAKSLQEEGRGSYDFRSAKDIMLVRWNDNSVVTIATNYEHLSLGTASRWSREKKAKVQVQQPTVFATYNKAMGGVDLLDQNIAAYRTRMRQRKWWWPIFVYLFDAAVTNAWILNRKVLPIDEAVGQLLKFRRNLALVILKKHGKPSIQGKTYPTPLAELRGDTIDHWPLENDTQRRCAQCPGKAKFICSKCKVGLHPKCFMDYHKNK